MITFFNFSDYMVWKIYLPIAALVFHVFFYGVLLYIIDSTTDGQTFGMMIGKKNEKAATNKDVIEDEEEKVKEERVRVAAHMSDDGDGESDAVVAVDSLRKLYDPPNPASKCCEKEAKKKEKLAVRNLSFMVTEGEVFGLLGHNGAGKTTTMKMIICEVEPTAGTVTIAGEDAKKGIKNLGYCPQFDVYWRKVTVEEHIKFFADIRGVPKDKVDEHVQEYIVGLRIQEHAQVRVRLMLSN